MDLEALYHHLMSKKGATEDFPFGPDVAAFRVMEKIFALVALDNLPPFINLKCDPERALMLRDRHAAVKPGYHMNKKHWNTLVLDGSVPDDEIRALIDHSYELVVQGLTKADRQTLQEQDA